MVAGIIAFVLCVVVAALTWTAKPAADTWAAVATWLTLLVALGAAVIALQQAVSAREQRADDEEQAEKVRRDERRHAREMQQRETSEARRRLREELESQQRIAVMQTQPYVVVTVEALALASGVFAELVVRNTGRTPAYDVVITFDPPPKRVLGPGQPARDLKVPERFPVLAPDQEWRSTWINLERQSEKDELPIPGVVTATVTFKRDGDRDPIGGPFVYELDPRTLIYTRLVLYGEHEAAKALREVAKEIKSWKGPGGRGLRVWARDGDAQARREQEAYANEEVNGFVVSDPPDSTGLRARALQLARRAGTALFGP